MEAGASSSAGAGTATSVRIYEVGPRDGLQAETAVIPTETKAQFIERLVAAGSRTVELTSFVSPRWIPQLADAEELMGRLHLPDSVRTVVLVPNRKGLERAVAAGASEVAVFVSATKEFAKRNLNSTVDGAIAAAAEVTTAARAWDFPSAATSPCASATPGKAPCPSSVSPTSQRP